MREIKFRAWAKYGEMLPNVQNHINGDWAFGNLLNKTDEFAIMQYTGLKDKNNVEIFEGDIIKDDFNVAEVMFHTEEIGSCGCCYTGFEGSGFAAFVDGKRGSVCLGDCCEVIGNIYETPHLLKDA